MSTEEMARALRAEGPMAIMIGGKECHVRPLGVRELTEVERDCLERYKRSYLETYSRNLDLLPPERASKVMEEKMNQVARWDTEDLPAKTAYDPARIQLSQSLKDRLVEVLNVDPSKTDERRWKRMASAAIDQEMISEAEYQQMTGARAPSVKVPYVNWWITGCYEGMISLVHACFKRNGVTREDVIEALTGRMSILVDMSHEIERLSAPQVGNG